MAPINIDYDGIMNPSDGRRRTTEKRFVACILCICFGSAIDVLLRYDRHELSVAAGEITLTTPRSPPPKEMISSKDKLPLSETSSELLLRNIGVDPKAFPSWNQTEVPCFAPERNWLSFHVGNTPAQKGLILVKSPKTGSSTASNIHLRIATSLGRKNNLHPIPVCKNRFHHKPAFKYAGRNRTKSFMWSLVRDPTSRFISKFFHFEVSRRGVEPSDDNVIPFLEKNVYRKSQIDYLKLSRQKPNNETKEEVINSILDNYDFLGVTERMDESAVALQMILGLETKDVMFLRSIKSKGNYDDGLFKSGCVLIQESFKSPRVEEYIQSESWKRAVYWDEVLHTAANVSLDLTIEMLGRDEFERNLALFRLAQTDLSTKCSNVVLPCDDRGRKRIRNDCLYGDNGCGFKCMDEYFREQRNGGSSAVNS